MLIVMFKNKKKKKSYTPYNQIKSVKPILLSFHKNELFYGKQRSFVFI